MRTGYGIQQTNLIPAPLPLMDPPSKPHCLLLQTLQDSSKMRWKRLLLWLFATTAVAQSTDGISKLVNRRLPEHIDSFRFEINSNLTGDYDAYAVESSPDGTILVEGNSLSALSTG